MRTSWRLTKWRGVPILLDWTVFLGFAWFYYQYRSVAGMALAFAAFFVLLLAHELGHAAVAKWRRVPVIEIRLLFLHGFCRHEAVHEEVDDVWIAWGGVAAQAVLAALTFGLSELLRAQAFEVYVELLPVMHTLVVTNLFIIGMNLLPIPPLDGAKAWRVLPLSWRRLQNTQWMAHRRFRRDVERGKRERRLETQSEQITADIIERLKKRQ